MRKKNAKASPLRAKYDWPDCGPSSWWWFEKDNRQYVHEFSSAWEILRRSRVFRQLHSDMTLANAQAGSLPGGSQFDRAQMFRDQVHAMLPKSPPAAKELLEMVGRWQTMIVNGWTPEKTYLEASEDAELQGTLPDGKVIRIPPILGGRNRGIPVILPRQVAPLGHLRLAAALCEFGGGDSASVKHLAGNPSVAQMMNTMLRDGLSGNARKLTGKHIAVWFPILQPAPALKHLLHHALDAIQQSGRWLWNQNPDTRPERFLFPITLAPGTEPMDAVAFFPADTPPQLVESAFNTLIRPRTLDQRLPELKARWVKWRASSDIAIMKGVAVGGVPVQRTFQQWARDSREVWKRAERLGRLCRESLRQPFTPDLILRDLSAFDCGLGKSPQRDALIDLLWENPEMRKGRKGKREFSNFVTDFNKLVRNGRNAVEGVDSLLLP